MDQDAGATIVTSAIPRKIVEAIRQISETVAIIRAAEHTAQYANVKDVKRRRRIQCIKFV